MFDSEMSRRIGVVLAIATLCFAIAGYADDIGTTKADKSDAGNQLRYYGGPKSLMWPSQ
jgi:hypothetical protein